MRRGGRDAVVLFSNIGMSSNPPTPILQHKLIPSQSFLTASIRLCPLCEGRMVYESPEDEQAKLHLCAIQKALLMQSNRAFSHEIEQLLFYFYCNLSDV